MKLLPKAGVRVGLCLTLGLASFAVVVPAGVAGAVDPSCSTPVVAGNTATVTCNYNGTTGADGSVQTWTVPAGITQATFDVFGAQGGETGGVIANTHRGGETTALLSVTPGATLSIVVAGRGTTGNFCAATAAPGGFGGGGAGGTAQCSGSGGGGASSVSDGTTRLLVAGGGGGDANICSTTCAEGGNGGGPSGTAGTTASGSPGGAGGTQAGGGVASGGATSGTAGLGGNGAGASCQGGSVAGGGGGGGYFGGGGGDCAGGGGGSGFVTPSALSSSSQTGVRSGHGLVTISYDLPAVACEPGFFSATGNEPCTAAPAGYYVDITRATSATACAPGSYQPATAQTSCTLASKGYFVDTEGATAQTECPSGSTTTVTGATECVHINQAPSFTKGSDQVVLANASAQTVSPWATAISPGPASESGQRLDFIVSNDNPALFSAQPSVDVDGTLHFTPAASQTGVAAVTVKLRDDGGTAAGGVDTSAEQQFTITVNQAPSFAPDTSPPLTASVGQPYGYPFVATGYPATITYTLVGAPSWLTIDANGAVGGTPPTGTKTFTYSVKATNTAGFATAGPYTVTVAAPPAPSTKADVSTTLSCPTSAKINVNTTCTLTVRNAGPATAKNVWVALALPSSLTRVSNSGAAVWWRNIATWKIASLNANATSALTITFKARTTGKAAIGGATASTSPDPNWKNNVTAATITFTR